MILQLWESGGYSFVDLCLGTLVHWSVCSICHFCVVFYYYACIIELELKIGYHDRSIKREMHYDFTEENSEGKYLRLSESVVQK